MGGRLVIPEADPKTEKAIKLYEFNPREVSKFWKLFQALDKMKIGFVKLDDIYEECEYQRNVYTDALCQLLEIEMDDGEINFNDFLLMISTYCMFEIAEILRFCVFLFDQDRSGMCEVEDVKEIMNILNNIIAPATVRGTIKKGWQGVEFDADGNVDFKQMLEIYKQFPRLFQPAFRLQQQMMIRFMGVTWWERKKLRNKDNREKAERIMEKKKQKKLDKIQAKKNRAIKRNMGILKYYFCPWSRYLYDPDWAMNNMTDEEKAARARSLALAKRLAELKAKNPETATWENFKKRIDPSKGGAEDYVLNKHVKTEKYREERQLTREERKAIRNKDPSTKYKEEIIVSDHDL